MNQEIWEEAPTLTLRGISRAVPLRNFAGRNYMAYVDVLLARQLGIKDSDRVLDVGGGATPFSRADVVTDAYLDDDTHRIGRSIPRDKTYVECFVENLPFEDTEFDVAVSRHVIEHATDPEAACREISRVARRGYIEVPSHWSEYFYGYPPHRWLISVENGVLVFRPRPFVRNPFLNCLRWMEYHDPDFTFRWNLEFRNLITTQFPWEGEIPCRIENGHGFDYDEPAQAAESHVSFVINAIRFGGVTPEVLEYEARAAVRFQPEFALAHNTLGIVLWMAKRYDESRDSFFQAYQLEPGDDAYRHNASLGNGTGQAQLKTLPPDPDDKMRDENFAGPLFPPILGDKGSLLADKLNIGTDERVLDISNCSHFFQRADVTVRPRAAFPVPCDESFAQSSDRCIQAVPTQLPFQDGGFDVAVTRGILEQSDDPGRLCMEMQRAAKRGFIEVPNSNWEYIYGNPRNRWLFERKDDVLIIRKKNFAKIPFKSVIVPLLIRFPELRHRFEVSFRNLTHIQFPWTGGFEYRVEDAADDAYDYDRAADALIAHLDCAYNLCNQGASEAALPEADAVLAINPDHPDGLNMRGAIAWALGRRREGLDYVSRAARLAPHNSQIAENYRIMRKQLDERSAGDL